MKKDLPENLVRDIGIAVVLESDSPQGRSWNVYLINLKDANLETVLISSKGYGLKDGVDVKTSILRHSIGNVPAKATARVEAIDEQIFGLTNEYLLSFYIDGQIFDKKYIFVPESIVESNMVRIPLLNKPGILIL